MMQSNLANGETISVGAACMVTFFAGAFAAMVGQLDAQGRVVNGALLATVADALGLRIADEMPPQPPAPAGQAEYEAAKALIDNPSLYEDGNTEYGLEQALELARRLVAEHEAAQ